MPKGTNGIAEQVKKGKLLRQFDRGEFFKTLKTEIAYHKKFQTRLQPKLELFDYIEVCYNRKRRQLALGY